MHTHHVHSESTAVSKEEKPESYGKGTVPSNLICHLSKLGTDLLIVFEIYRAVFRGILVVKNKVFFIILM